MSTRLSLPCPPEAIDAFLSVPTPGVYETLSRVEGDVVVLGAGGKMGASLSLMLRDGLKGRGKVLAVSRFSDAAARAKFEGIETIPCDLLDQNAVNALPEAPTVFYLAGQKFGTAAAPELTWAMNAVVPAYVAQRYRNSRIVAFSTGCVYPFVPVHSGGSREEDAPDPTGDYAYSCVARERVFAYFAKQFGNPLCLYRLNYAVEPRYGVPVDLGLKILAGEPIDVTMGYVNVIWQRDAVARAIQCLDLLNGAGTPPVAMNVTGPELVPVRQIALGLGERLGREVTLTGTEAPTAWLSNAGRSFQLWGYPEVSLDQMLDWVAAWLLENAPTLNKPTHFETRDGKY